ncbi:type IV secretory system conjugative DNA transfer family protein [Actinomadura montaniterrae]|uniref:Type IV secretory system conjugative DNA transfer family protein n=1 Tax=Actinomadura montaniterrae TaxID=1803903 RepID=A0A6L3W2W6_9ACTN|nr:TraM recognition domain-containing protein [Actinomadura montaniterrae]KAB2385933.1 type IV secretory system conjugative DNA transfer family protein [Actinomadura montaniterrae]
MSGGDDDDVYTAFLGVALLVFLLGGACGFLMWLAGQFSGLLAGGGWPDSSPSEFLEIAFRFVQDPGDPRGAWPSAAAGSLGPSSVFFVLLFIFLAFFSTGVYFLARLLLNVRRRRPVRRLRLGFASGWEVRKLLSARTVLSKAHRVRPSLVDRPAREVRPEDVGFYIGRDIRSRRKLYTSLEDMMIVVAAPRQGKDVHFVTPFTVDAPGPCIVTSSRRETFVNTAMVRAQYGRVYVFDPFNWTAWPHRLRWNFLDNCQDTNVCAVRSGTLVSTSGFEMGREGAHVLGGVTTIIRCLLHAGAIGGLTIRDVVRWVYEANADEAMDILRQGEQEGSVAPGYSAQLEYNRRDERLWAGVMQVMSCFSIPGVLDDLSPGPGEEFDYKEFLKGRNTLYFVSKQQTDHGGIAPIVTTIVEQFFRSARGAAMKNPTGRLEPPLTFELNQVTDICPIPGLATYMGESGGYGITVHAYLTSLADARAKWGSEGATRLWDNATFRVISGGTGTAKDLSDLSDLVGKHDGKPTLQPEEIRTMPFGRAALVAGTARPVEMWLTPWWKRKDRDEIARGKQAVEEMIRRQTAGQEPIVGTVSAASTLDEEDPWPGL